MIYKQLEKQLEDTTWREDNRIDDSDLILEWKKTMILYEKWSKKASEAQRRVADLELQIKVKKAEVSLEVRSSPDQYGWVPKSRTPDPTEDFVKSCVKMNSDYQELNKEYFEAVRDHSDVKAAQDSIMWLRKEAVSDMVKVFLSTGSMGNSELMEIKDRVLREVQAKELNEISQSMKGETK